MQFFLQTCYLATVTTRLKFLLPLYFPASSAILCLSHADHDPRGN